MMRMRGLTWMLAGAALLPGQVPVEKAWGILKSASEDKSHERRARSVAALAQIVNNPQARAIAEKGLGDEEEEVRTAAAETLGRIGTAESIPKLQAAVKDKSFSVILAAANSLAALKDKAAYHVYYAVLTGEKKTGEGLVDSQMKMLKDPKALTKMGFEQGIGFVPFGGVSYQVLKMVTRDDTSPVRAAAAVKLASDPDPKSLQALRTATTDKKWLVRAAAVSSLGQRNDPAALDAVVPLLDDEHEVVKFAAASVVVRLSAVGAGRRK